MIPAFGNGILAIVLSFCGSLSLSTLLLFGSSLFLSCFSASFSTFIVALAVFWPSSVIAEISAVPSLTPVTTPFSSTVATFSLLDVHFIFLFVAISGLIVATSVIFFPTFILPLIGVTLIPVTLFCFFSTVILLVAVLFPSSYIAVIVTLPSFIPVTIPFSSTVAILSLLDIHFTFFICCIFWINFSCKYNFFTRFYFSFFWSN